MSFSDAYQPGRDADYEAAERICSELPGQLARVRREAQVLRERLASPETARERAVHAAADEAQGPGG